MYIPGLLILLQYVRSYVNCELDSHMSMEDCCCLFNIQATTLTNEYGAYMNTYKIATKRHTRMRLSEPFTGKLKDSCWLHKRGYVKFVVPLICQPSCEYRSQGGVIQSKRGGLFLRLKASLERVL